MKGNFINTINPEISAAIKFTSRKGKYTFIALLFAIDKEDRSCFTGRFDFDYKNSSRLTNKGLANINKYKQNCFDAIDKLFALGAEFIVIEAAPDKKVKRLKLYERLLKTRYNIFRTTEDMLFLEKTMDQY